MTFTKLRNNNKIIITKNETYKRIMIALDLTGRAVENLEYPTSMPLFKPGTFIS
jgi:hypothetical protein